MNHSPRQSGWRGHWLGHRLQGDKVLRLHAKQFEEIGAPQAPEHDA